MKALVYTGPNRIELRDEPDPQSNDETIVRVAACGICGSDMHAYHGHDERRPAPLILGHEAAGVVQSGAWSGRRVAINPLVSCMTCDACLAGRQHLCPGRVIVSMPARPGALAEFVRVPDRNLVILPDDMPFERAALTEPLAVAYHAVNLAERSLSRPLAASRAAVLGGGAIGLCVAQVLESRGARGIAIAETAEIRRTRLARAGRFQPYDPAGRKLMVGDLHALDPLDDDREHRLESRVPRAGGIRCFARRFLLDRFRDLLARVEIEPYLLVRVLRQQDPTVVR